VDELPPCKGFDGLTVDWGSIRQISNTKLNKVPLIMKEYARAEGVLAELGAALESAIGLSCGNGVSETAEYCEKVPCTSARPHVDLVLDGNGTSTRLTRADT
jgi:hypothetical protein